jgi:hypothetical protein
VETKTLPPIPSTVQFLTQSAFISSAITPSAPRSFTTLFVVSTPADEPSIQSTRLSTRTRCRPEISPFALMAELSPPPKELEWIADNLESRSFLSTFDPHDPEALQVPIHHAEWKLLRTDFTIFQNTENNTTHITRDFVAQNIGKRPLSHRLSSVTYACANSAVEYNVTSLDDPALQWSCVERLSERAKLLIRFSRPVAPGETIRYRITLLVPNSDSLDSFHEYVAKTPCDRFSLQVIYPQTHRFVSAVATAEQHGTYSWKDLPDPTISQNGDNLTTLDWHTTSIRTGVKYRLAWSVKKQEALPSETANAPRPASRTKSLSDLATLHRRYFTPKLPQ